MTHETNNNFCHLSLRTKASLLFGSADTKKIVAKAKELGQPALAITDYSNVFEAVNFYTAATSAGVKPILGIDLYFTEDAEQSKIQKIRQVTHVILLAENETGWKNITRLLSMANTPEYFFYNPRIDFKLLEQHKEGIICLSGSSFDGVIASLLYDKLDATGEIREPAALFKAEGLVRRFLKIFDKDHFFLEVQDHGFAIQSQINGRLRTIATKYGLRTVATNNVHYTEQHDAESHKTLLAMSANQYSRSTSTDFFAEEYYLKSREELSEELTQDELDLTLEIAERCNVAIDLKKRRLPHYKFTPKDKTSNQYLRELTLEKFGRFGFTDRPGQEKYFDRLDRELSDIEEMGFADYFLIVHDVIDWVRGQNILVGRGRGSAGGSLVSYALGITEIDPLEYGLIWERFLNKGRGGLPDIDTDVPRSKRQKVLEYIRNRFGEENVAQLVTLGGLQAKAILKEVFKVYGMAFDEANKITSLVPAKNDEHAAISLQEAIDAVPELKEYYDKYTPWFKIALALEGCYKSIGIHAAAVVISDSPFEESSYPLVRSKDGNLLFGWDMNTVDTLSLLKLDILGLTTLDDIQVTMDLVKERRGIELSRMAMPLDDPITWSMIGQGFTVGVFQIEKQLGKTWSKNLKPESIQELSDLVSIIRPGAMESDMHTAYRNVKCKGEEASYIHDSLEPIMSSTYSALIYQEQVIYICQQLAGMSLIDADHVRKAMGKKKPEEMAKWQETFVAGCVKNKIDAIIANDIWGYIAKFAGYGFNRCLSGSTQVTKAGANQYSDREISIAKLWEYFHGDLKKTPTGKKYRNKTHPRLGLRIMMQRKDRAVPGRILDVIRNGPKETFLVKTSDGKVIRGTKDHRLLTDNGWKKIEDLKVNFDSLVVSDLTYEITSNAYFAEISRVSRGERLFKKNVPYYGIGQDNAGYIDGSSVILKQIKKDKVNEIGRCEYCDKVNSRLELAHLDGDHTNQNEDNLRLLCVSCHKKHDYKFNDRRRRFEKGYPISTSTIIFIGDPEIEETYDIEMAEPEHNFFGNGIVSHNSHGVGYALLAYETAYLKSNYTVEFLCAKLRHAESHPDKFEQLSILVYDAKLFDIEVTPPRVSTGNKDFAVTGDQSIAFGLSALKGVGAGAINDIVKMNSDSFDEIIWKWKTTKNKVTTAAMTALIRGGAFDDIQEHRVESQARFRLLEGLTEKEIEVVQELLPHQNSEHDWVKIVRAISDETKSALVKDKYGVKIPNVRRRETIRELLKDFDGRELFDTKAQRIAWEQNYLGISLSGSEADIYKAENQCIELIRSGYPDMRFEIAVCIDSINQIVTKKGDAMAFLTARDKTYVMDNIVVFPRTFEIAKKLLEEGNVVKIRGKVDDRGSLLADKIERLR